MSIAVLDLFAPPRITAQRRADGTILVRSIEDLEPACSTPTGCCAPTSRRTARCGRSCAPSRR
jgi:hypothetical protein